MACLTNPDWPRPCNEYPENWCAQCPRRQVRHCRGCDHAHGSRGVWPLSCRRHAPAAIHRPDGPRTHGREWFAQWPVVEATDGCGDFTPMAPAEPRED